MINVVFVGDSPSALNSTALPFIGSKSFGRLIEWIAVLEPDYYVVLNSDSDQQLRTVQELSLSGFKVVALGTKSSSRLSKSNIPHHALPHPSGLNRQLNNSNFVKACLEACKQYLQQ